MPLLLLKTLVDKMWNKWLHRYDQSWIVITNTPSPTLNQSERDEAGLSRDLYKNEITNF